MERLKEYRRKRDFAGTPEPAGDAAPQTGGNRFVVHKHAATRLHYDLRLEQEGVLRSWALPKGPSLTPGERRLAVEVEDHPLAYADFEGTIPAGHYGGGTIMLWDRGRWRDAGVGEGAARRPDRIDLVLEGEKLRGAWTLTRAGGRRDDTTAWLLIKRRDRGAQPLDPHDRSVLTGRTMEEIARGDPPHEREGAEEGREPDGGRRAGARAPADGARRGDLPDTVALQLASLVADAPDGDDWLHEIKFDGYRIAARLDDGEIRLTTRNAHDWTERFPEIASALRALPHRSALLDGEVVAFADDGVSSFGALQEALRTGATAALRYQVFDLLHLDGLDLHRAPQAARKAELARVLAGAGPVLGPAVRHTDHVTGQGRAFFAHACRLGLEGIISKHRDAPYRPGRHDRWRKVKCTRSAVFVVGGFTPPSGSRHGFGALLLGRHEGAALAYAGRVGSGFGDRELRRLHARLRDLERPTSPFAGPVPDARGATWVEPEVHVEVRFTEVTGEGRLRHPTFRGLAAPPAAPPDRARPASVDTAPRATKAASRSRSPGPAPPPRAPTSRRRSGSDDAEVAGVRLTNADRVLYPEQGITKLALARYYESIEEHVLPGMAGRPLALVRCPQGRGEACFYQKHPGDAFPRTLPRVVVEEKAGAREYATVETIGDLVALVQVGVLEVHVWGSRVGDVERPDLMVIDLDPGPDVAWSLVRRTAVTLKARLESLGLHAFPRTTGGKGVHVVVPLVPHREWPVVKAFAKALCERHAEEHPDELVTTASKSKREGRVYLDYLRNGRGATAIASYSTRARPGAPVAVPVRWDELNASLRPDRYHVGNVGRRLAALGDDPWSGFRDAAGELGDDVLAAVAAPKSRTTRGRR